MELNEQTLEEILIRQRQEYQRPLQEIRDEVRHVGILTESLRSDVQALAEGHATLRQEMADRFQEVKLDLEQIRLEMEMMRSELSIIRSDLKQKVGRDELAVLEARVAKLEQAVRAR